MKLIALTLFERLAIESGCPDPHLTQVFKVCETKLISYLLMSPSVCLIIVDLVSTDHQHRTIIVR